MVGIKESEFQPPHDWKSPDLVLVNVVTGWQTKAQVIVLKAKLVRYVSRKRMGSVLIEYRRKWKWGNKWTESELRLNPECSTGLWSGSFAKECEREWMWLCNVLIYVRENQQMWSLNLKWRAPRNLSGASLVVSWQEQNPKIKEHLSKIMQVTEIDIIVLFHSNMN